MELDIQGKCLIEASNRENSFMTEQAWVVFVFSFFNEEKGKKKRGDGGGEVGRRTKCWHVTEQLSADIFLHDCYSGLQVPAEQ